MSHIPFWKIFVIISGLMLFSINNGYACGGQGPCAGTSEGVHGHAHLTIINLTSHKEIAIPANIGLKPMKNADGKESFCYEATHTHDASGTLHFQTAEGNITTLGAFLTAWGQTNLLMNARVTADGKTVTDPMELVLKPEIRIEISFYGPQS